MTIRAARRIPDLQVGTPEWLKLATASKVAAILRLSPWQSRFAVYYAMAGMLPHDEGSDVTRRGNYLEAGVAAWFADERPDLRVCKTGSWVSKARPWQSATPDRLLYEGRRAAGLLEIKTSAQWESWGRDGSDDVPAYYRAQVLWQLDVLGLRTAHLAVLLPKLNFRSYVIQYDREEAEWIRQEVANFLDSLPGGPKECPPDIDEDDSTYEAIRKLNPEMEDRDVTLTLDDAREFLTAIEDCKRAKAAEVGAKSKVASLMGEARRAVLDVGDGEPIVVATRQVKAGGVPYVAPSRAKAVREALGV